MNSAVPVQFNLGDRTLAGLEWGDRDKPLVIALHGWLDNAASFFRLAPLLSDYRILALDMAGHGHSDWRSGDAGYPVWGYVEDLRQVVLQLSCEPVALLGHSLGAGVVSLYAGVWPHSVSALLLLENLGPAVDSASDFPSQLAYAVNARLAPSREVAPRSLETWVKSRMLGQFPVDRESAHQLMLRNTRALNADPTQRVLAIDPALRVPSLVRLTEAQVCAALSAISAPVKLILGEPGIARELTRNRPSCVSQLEIDQFAAGHHLHLESQWVAAVAEQVNHFYDRYIG